MRREHQTITIRAAALTAVLALVACGSEEQAEFEDVDTTASPEAVEETGQAGEDEAESPDPQDDTDSPDPEMSEAEGVTTTATFLPHYASVRASGEVTLEATIGPVIRDGDLASLSMEFDYLEGEEELSTMSFLQGLAGVADGNLSGGQVRLIDPEAMSVAELARVDGGEGSIAAASGSSGDGFGDRAETGESLNWFGIFAAPESDTASVLLPHFGLVSDVPVVEGDLDETNSTEERFDYSDITGASHELVTWRDTPEYTIEIEGDETTVSLPSDVLFDVDSSDLSSEAEDALEAAAQEMAGTDGGELRIVGHTDDVLDEEYNQTLSEERAEAVHQRLQEVADLEAFDEVSVSGESFREPIAENNSDEGRAMNRRVELHFTTVTNPEEQVIEGELPEPQGPVGTADEKITVNAGDGGPYANEDVILSVESLERHDGLIVAGIRAESTEEGANINWPFALGAGGAHRAGVSQVSSVDLPYLVAGDHWVEPLRYFVTDVEVDDEDPEESDISGRDFHRLTDVLFGSYRDYNEGDSAVAYLVYPDIGGEELTLESPGEHEGTDWFLRQIGVNPWRFEDIPVTEAGS
ncbi:OmpA family protein [Nesterenkonia haasae]|uniref:OmpA family protein n=1 Tax=Nesterenkonia haasae TaxID=2587813 RepID=UPI0013910CAC|nr:OmpA family protein [Nesterenkonia haasae]NDK31803.1 OmpA family protein [Nesterenkonia haasae]